jgi:hypothetical protein
MGKVIIIIGISCCGVIVSLGIHLCAIRSVVRQLFVVFNVVVVVIIVVVPYGYIC